MEENLPKEGRLRLVLCDNLDQIIMELLDCSMRLKLENNEAMVDDLLSLRIKLLDFDVKAQSVAQLQICKHFILSYVNKCLYMTNVQEKLESRQLFEFLELCFKRLLIAEEGDFCINILDNIKSYLLESDCKLNSHIPNLSSMIVFDSLLSALKSESTSMNFKNDSNLGNYLQRDDLQKVISNLVLNCSEHHPVASYTLLSVLPKLVEVSGTRKVLHFLWSDVTCEGEIQLSHKLFIFCGTADLFPCKDSFEPSIIKSTVFFNLIQEGLISNDAALRKKGLYLLKRTIDFVASFNLQLNLKIFSWNFVESTLLLQLWNTVFILLEVLEEKQAHLVYPVVQTALKPEDLKLVHPSWLLVVYTRLLSHDSHQIIRLGLLSFFKMKIDLYTSSAYKHIIHLAFQKLNNMLLFTCNVAVNEKCEMDDALKEWFSDILVNTSLKEEFFSNVIDALVNVQWCTIPLFHILHTMSLIQEDEIFDDATLLSLCNFVKEVIRAQNVFIRGAVQCAMLNVITKLSKRKLDVLTIANTLGFFKQTECLHRGRRTWETTKCWVQSSLLKEEDILEKILNPENNLPQETKARVLVLFFDCGLIDSNPKNSSKIKEYFNVLEDTRTRPHASIDKSNSCLELILHILKESRGISNVLDIRTDPLINIIKPFVNEVIDFTYKRLRYFYDNEQLTLEEIELYCSCTSAVEDCDLVPVDKFKELINLAEKTTLSPKLLSPVLNLFGSKVMLWFLHFIQKENKFNGGIISNTFKKHFFSVIQGDRLTSNLFQNEDTLSSDLIQRGPLIAAYIFTQWSILHVCLKEGFVNVDEITSLISTEELIQNATNSIEAGGWKALVPILGVVKSVLPHALNDLECCKRFLQFSWKSCFELRKVALFWPAIKSWIEMAFSTSIILKKEMQNNLLEYADQILSQGEAVVGLSNVLMSHLKHELRSSQVVEPLLPTITSALLFGPVLRRDQRIENDTCELIRSFGSEYTVNDLIPQLDDHSSQEVRASALSVVLRLADEQLTVEVVRRLLETDKQLTAQRQRYHGDSLHHRLKHRILQALLVLESLLHKSSSFLAKSCLVELVKWSSAALQGESQQPSVRYQLEWLLIRSLLHCPDLLSDFWTIFSQASDERTGSICSFISVAYHLAATLRDRVFIEQCVTEILPWCMAQHFNVRLYSQVVLQKLWPMDDEVALKYKVIRNSLSKSLNQGNAVRNAEKLKTDFYFTVFHPLEHFSFETIFWELPRLSNISRDEWTSPSTLKECLAEIHSEVPLNNQNDDLKHFSTASWIVKATVESDVEIEVEASGMQKKFMPWKGMLPELDAGRTSPRTELIVVASLIDKVPNLGGLARSCEVFTAQALVVASLEYTRDKLFSTLSMSAEKHINIIEVKPHALPEYLRAMKGSGYTLVGAEQTASSVSLETYKFPKKCLLVLGNEKEGIPVNLLPLLDVCVEVRQLGLVRSLNVHVTGALFVWEYTRQYLAVVEGKLTQ